MLVRPGTFSEDDDDEAFVEETTYQIGFFSLSPCDDDDKDSGVVWRRSSLIRLAAFGIWEL